MQINSEPLFRYDWSLKDIKQDQLQSGKVFSCFACGGGSTMGYKLAGFDVIGCNEIDPEMNRIYLKNHKPKYNFLEPIQEFINRTEYPAELYQLDILDGSPPCSSFSMAGNRGDDWGKKKVFREGQSEQILDTLFFDFIKLSKKLQPKIVVAENVKGLLLGDAIDYVKKIYQEFNEAGYYLQHFLLNSQDMGVPQKRERVFFIGLRKDLAGKFLKRVDFFTELPELKLKFNFEKITFEKIMTDEDDYHLTDYDLNIWNKKKKGDKDYADVLIREENRESNWNSKFIYGTEVCNTIAATEGSKLVLFDKPRKVNNTELKLAGSFPLDYDFEDVSVKYVIGMSVPPVMIAHIANEIKRQWIDKF